MGLPLESFAGSFLTRMLTTAGFARLLIEVKALAVVSKVGIGSAGISWLRQVPGEKVIRNKKNIGKSMAKYVIELVLRGYFMVCSVEGELGLPWLL